MMKEITENYPSIAQAEAQVRACFSDSSRVPEIFHNCIADTLKQTIRVMEDGSMYVITGDIPAMWLRDSACQLHLFTKFAKDEPELQRIIEGVIRRQVECVLLDPYANAFLADTSKTSSGSSPWITDHTRMKPGLWERKYEIDSLCYPIRLSYEYYRQTGRTDCFTDRWKMAAKLIIETFRTEQHHETLSEYRFIRDNTVYYDTLSREGKGALVNDGIGLIFSGFRPSDDACTYGYLIPSNMFASVCLGYLSEIFANVYHDFELSGEAAAFSEEIRCAVEKYGVLPGRNEKIYAYEVDGFGQYLLMDDANVPSLLSMPYYGYCRADDKGYLSTKKVLLSEENPYYYRGSALQGIGSPHTSAGFVWDISLAVQGLVSTDPEEKRQMIMTMAENDAGTGLMHESIDADDPQSYTRPWFSWANCMFCELVWDYCRRDQRPETVK